MRLAPRLFAPLSLLGLLAGTAAHAAWPHDPDGVGLLLRPSQLQAYTPATCPDGAGGYFCAWDENYVIYAQHVDASGRLLWGPDGVLVASGTGTRYEPSLCRDGSSGVILSWQDSRSGNHDIYVQRLNAAGVPQWTPNGVALCTNPATQSVVRAAADGNGGALVIWSDVRSGSGRIYSRMVNSAGTPQGAADGVELATSAAGTQSGHQVVRNRTGYFVVAWVDTRTDAGDIYAQLVTSAGVPLTPGGGVICNAIGLQTSVALSQDSGTGTLATWSDVRGASNDIYAMRNSGTGMALWAANGVPVCTAISPQVAPSIAPDPTGGAFVAWTDSRNSATTFSDIYVQHLSAAGAPLWTADGVAVCAQIGSQEEVEVIPDAAGGAIAVWLDRRHMDSSNADVYAQRLNSSGTALWTAQGVPVNVSWRDARSPVPCDDGRGGVIATWRAVVSNPSDVQIASSRVDEWGYLGAEPVIANVEDVPNDQGGQVKLSWNASPLDTDPLFRNISSYWLYRAAPPNLVAAARRAGATFATPGATAGQATPPRFLQTRTAAQDYYWEVVTTLTAAHLATYSDVVPTTGDSVGGSNPRTAFMVMARNSSGSMWWTSEPDSGYSVDNLAPAAPAPFTGQYAAGTAHLHWNPNAEPDVAGYELHRGTSVSFTPSPANLVSAQPDTGYADAAGAPFVYKLLAVDSHGNRSPVATLIPTGTLAVDGPAPAVAFLAPPSPNPSRAGGMMRFGLSAGGAAKLVLYDAQGRSVRVLFTGTLPAGEHAIAFDGRDDGGRALAPGLYLARLVAPGFAATQRLAVID